MLVSNRHLSTIDPSLIPMNIYESSPTNRHTTSLIPPTSLPKCFNVPFAIQHGYFRCIRYLLELNYDPNERDSQLRTPLILCAYIENDRWSLSLAQNLLEKGAKVALEDHARRNAMHHACALQCLHLVQLYLSCLDFNLEAKDYEGNTCLHYAAITGNCEVADLLIRSADKLGIRLDQLINRDGCSAAVLALKYGHIECANQITHRDWDEFFVVPRPLSIYETPPSTDDNQTSTTTMNTKPRTKISSIKSEFRPPTLSFGLLKIIFNESDTGYSTRLAGLCKQDKQKRLRPQSKTKKHEAIQTSITTINKSERTKSTVNNGIHTSSSTEALVNETQISNLTKDCQTNLDNHHHHHQQQQQQQHKHKHKDRTSPRIQLLIQQKFPTKFNSTFIQHTTSKAQLSIDDMNKMKLNFIKIDNDDAKSKSSIPTIYRQVSTSTLNQSDYQPFTRQRAKTAVVRKEVYINPPPSRLSNHTIKATPSRSSAKKKSVIIKQSNSPSHSASSTHSQSTRISRAKSAVVHRSNDSECSIREAKGTAARFNKPEDLFGVRPEQLFAPEQQQYQPKIFDSRSTNKTDESTRLKRQNLQTKHHLWQQDVDKIIELYNIHHSTSYRKSAMLPPPTIVTQLPSSLQPASNEILTESSYNMRSRGPTIAKTTHHAHAKPHSVSKQPVSGLLNNPQRNPSTRASMKINIT